MLDPLAALLNSRRGHAIRLLLSEGAEGEDLPTRQLLLPTGYGVVQFAGGLGKVDGPLVSGHHVPGRVVVRSTDSCRERQLKVGSWFVLVYNVRFVLVFWFSGQVLSGSVVIVCSTWLNYNVVFGIGLQYRSAFGEPAASTRLPARCVSCRCSGFRVGYVIHIYGRFFFYIYMVYISIRICVLTKLGRGSCATIHFVSLKCMEGGGDNLKRQ